MPAIVLQAKRLDHVRSYACVLLRLKPPQAVLAGPSLQDYYAANFSGESVGSLLGTLHRLDCERVAGALQRVNALPQGERIYRFMRMPAC